MAEPDLGNHLAQSRDGLTKQRPVPQVLLLGKLWQIGADKGEVLHDIAPETYEVLAALTTELRDHPVVQLLERRYRLTDRARRTCPEEHNVVHVLTLAVL